MKKYRYGTALVLAAALMALGVTACGNANSITSLTDSDSAAEAVEPVVTEEAAAESVVSGTVSVAEQAADTLPEIAAQTIEKPAGQPAQEKTEPEAPTAGANYDEEDDEDVDADEDEEETPAALSSSDHEEETPQQTSEDDPYEEEAENEEEHETPSDLDETDQIDIEETDEGGVHGEGNTATVTAASANVRSDPYVDEDDDNVIGVLYAGDVVTVLGNEDGWYRISFEGGSGYVSASLFD
ncbi:MAG: SH3 domain-containing protein [Lachnospiraceae bacterium]|nr:SH3 domain-containing protein [Lachnospiraceae bacterium]